MTYNLRRGMKAMIERGALIWPGPGPNYAQGDSPGPPARVGVVRVILTL